MARECIALWILVDDHWLSIWHLLNDETIHITEIPFNVTFQTLSFLKKLLLPPEKLGVVAFDRKTRAQRTEYDHAAESSKENQCKNDPSGESLMPVSSTSLLIYAPLIL